MDEYFNNVHNNMAIDADFRRSDEVNARRAARYPDRIIPDELDELLGRLAREDDERIADIALEADTTLKIIPTANLTVHRTWAKENGARPNFGNLPTGMQFRRWRLPSNKTCFISLFQRGIK
jgi:hypothetical protein